MRYRIFAVLISVLIFTGMAAAVEGNMKDLEEEDLEMIQEEFNQAEVPEGLKYVVGDQIVNLEIESGNYTRTLGIDMEGTNVEEIQNQSFENSTLDAEVDMDEVQEVVESDSPVETLNTKVKNEEIDYEAHTMGSSVRLSIAEKALGVVSYLNSVF